MPALISDLTKSEQRKLLDDLNYLNTSEIKAFCDKHAIPYRIWIETCNGGRRKTQDDDRKGVILGRIRHYLLSGTILAETCFPLSVVCLDDPPAKLQSGHKLFYGQYDKKSEPMVRLLKELTNGQFKDGAIARMLARDFWSKGKAPTYEEFAAAWSEARENHTQPNPEWAFLSDRANRRATANWKELRAKKARQVLSILNRIDVKKKRLSRR
jgi:hypothetical protein